MEPKTIYIASRGSALALAQANFVLGECRREFPDRRFALKIIKTTGDKLQTASLSRIDASLPRGLFTKELEEALLNGDADLAVHSLKDLPTILPPGLTLGATTKRADVRDVLIYRGMTNPVSTAAKEQGRRFESPLHIRDLPPNAAIGTSSTRRAAQLREQRPDLRIIPIRGNVGTRLNKLADLAEFDAIVLAAAGLQRLNFSIDPQGNLSGEGVAPGLRATCIEPDEMLPCVGQAALGIEIRENDPEVETLCSRINDLDSWHCVLAERAFLRALGGGCQSAVAAYAEILGEEIRLRAVSFLRRQVRRSEQRAPIDRAVQLGEALAAELFK